MPANTHEESPFYKGTAVSWALGACPLSSFHRIMDEGTAPKSMLDELFEKTRWSGKLSKEQGNVIFSVTSGTLLNREGYYNTPFVQYLLKHKNTQIIHWFKNNSHDPELIFICIHHRYPEDVFRKDIKNNVKEHIDRLYYDIDDHTYRMKDEV